MKKSYQELSKMMKKMMKKMMEIHKKMMKNDEKKNRMDLQTMNRVNGRTLRKILKRSVLCGVLVVRYLSRERTRPL